jgi:hypothetical protein
MLLLVAVLAGFARTAPSFASPVGPGYDLLQTVTGPGSYVDVALPANFFGPGSDPFESSILLAGNPLNQLDLGSTDTIVHRLPGGSLLGGTQVIPIELVALNLVSCQPITVKYTDGSTTQWDVKVTLAPSFPTQGQHILQHAFTDGGFMVDSFFDITYRIDFTGPLPPPSPIYQYDGLSRRIQAPFSNVPPPGIVTNPTYPAGNFFPGVYPPSLPPLTAPPLQYDGQNLHVTWALAKPILPLPPAGLAGIPALLMAVGIGRRWFK